MPDNRLFVNKYERALKRAAKRIKMKFFYSSVFSRELSLINETAFICGKEATFLLCNDILVEETNMK
jgi:hypothetical protein